MRLFLFLKGSDKFEQEVFGVLYENSIEKECLGELDNQNEVENLLERYILRFERDPKEKLELSQFHLFDAKGNVKGVRNMEIVDYLVKNVQFLWENHTSLL